MPRRAAAVADAGFRAGALAKDFLDAVALPGVTDAAGAFFAAAAGPCFRAGAFLTAGAVLASALQGSAPIAKVATKIRIVRMLDVTV